MQSQDFVQRQSSVLETGLSYLLGILVPGPGMNTVKHEQQQWPRLHGADVAKITPWIPSPCLSQMSKVFNA